MISLSNESADSGRLESINSSPIGFVGGAGTRDRRIGHFWLANWLAGLANGREKGGRGWGVVDVVGEKEQ